MNQHKNANEELSGLSTADDHAAAGWRPGCARPDGLLPGALVEQHRNCGKEGCRCTRGELHRPYVYLQVADRLAHVPATLAEAVRSRVEISRRLREVLREISAINLELLARRSGRRCAMPRGGPALRCPQGCSANSSRVIEAASHCWYCFLSVAGGVRADSSCRATSATTSRRLRCRCRAPAAAALCW
jgi:hypothetical protein